jgi:hypothetical protein
MAPPCARSIKLPCVYVTIWDNKIQKEILKTKIKYSHHSNKNLVVVFSFELKQQELWKQSEYIT